MTIVKVMITCICRATHDYQEKQHPLFVQAIIIANLTLTYSLTVIIVIIIINFNSFVVNVNGSLLNSSTTFSTCYKHNCLLCHHNCGGCYYPQCLRFLFTTFTYYFRVLTNHLCCSLYLYCCFVRVDVNTIYVTCHPDLCCVY